MTAVQAPAPGRRLFGLLPPAKPRIDVNGQPIKGRAVQQAGWSVIAAILGPCLIAGLYYVILEQRYYIHIGSFNHGASLKHWWDGGMGWIHSPSWVLYRHGVRDLLEPAAAIMGIKTLLASPKYWDKRVSGVRLVTAPVVLLALAIGMAVGGVWLLDFGLPNLWHHSFGTYTVTAPSAIANSSWQILLIGFVIAQVLHRYWAPVGATLQGFWVDRAVDRAHLTYRLPLWVRYPLMPPVVRERFARLFDTSTDETTEQHGATSRRLIVAVSIVLVLVTIIGGLAKFGFAHGLTVPYLTTH